MDSTSSKPKALGKGLSSLMPPRAMPGTMNWTLAEERARNPNKLPIEVLEPNPMQPRAVFKQELLEELADSIRAHGIIQPLVVRRHGDMFQIVAGERRWRAAKMVGLREVPVVVQQVTDRDLLELALIENIQRADLNPIEAAHAFDRLVRELGLSQEEIGRRTGKDRASIANLIRLLRLPKEVQALLADQRITMGHAKAILGLIDPKDQIEMAQRAANEGLSVRQVESRVKKSIEEQTAGRRVEKPQDPNVRAAAEGLERILGTRVRIVEVNEQRGRIEIEYYSQEELDRIYEQLTAGK
jgi:ParB family chromosome partitioning protein